MKNPYIEIIESMRVAELSEDMVDGLRNMLNVKEFKEIHELINSKLKEYDAFIHNQEHTIIGSFSIIPAEFYQTNNGSIVFSTNKIERPQEGGTVFEMVVLHGGYVDVDLDNDMARLMFGSFKVGDHYVVNAVGKSHAALLFDTYPMHVVKMLRKDRALDICKNSP